MWLTLLENSLFTLCYQVVITLVNEFQSKLRYKYSILGLIEPPVNLVKFVSRVTWQSQNQINSVNLLRLIRPTTLFRLIGSKWPGSDVTLLSGVFCIYKQLYFNKFYSA